MGYLSTLRGRIQINPPLRWSEFKDSDLYSRDARNSLKFDVNTEVTETESGFSEVRTALAVIPAWEDAFKYYELTSELRAFLTAFGNGRTFVGHLIREGEDQGDVERYSFVDGQLFIEKAELRWPDGTEVTCD